VARQSIGVRGARNGVRVFSWRLPRGLSHDPYRAQVDVTVTSMGAQPGTRRATRGGTVRFEPPGLFRGCAFVCSA
jgi:hypothetical protein